MLEPIDVGTQFTQWPLHITIMPWFSAPSIDDVKELLEPITKETKPFEVCIGDRAYFGPNQTLPVKLIDKVRVLQSLHEQILKVIESQGWQYPGRYTGAQYTPHVTQNAGKDGEGTSKIQAVYIAEALPQNYRKIVAKLELG